MPKDLINTRTKPGNSSDSAKSQPQPRFRNAESEIKSKSKSNTKARSEQTVSQPASASSSTAVSMISPVGTTTEPNHLLNQVEITYNQLASLGMPTDLISLTEFGRLYSPTTHSTSTVNSTTTLKSTKSKDTTIHAASTLTQTVDFICTHLVGRQEVRKRRALISQILEEHSTRPSKLKAPNNFHKEPTEDIRTLLNNPKQTAQVSNSSARRTLDAVQREWEVINEDVQRLDIKHCTKKRELEGARRVLFLLNVLERREELRMRRMGDVGRLVDDLRKEADLAMREFRNVAARSDVLMDREGGKISMGNIRYRHTTETLAKLHRYHLRGQPNEVDRLDVVLARLGVDDQDIKRKILQLAHKRTREKLERLVLVNQQKEKDVQMKINRVVALGFLTEGYLDCRLKDPEIQQQKGYIDKLRLAITVGESSAVGGSLPNERVNIPERLAIPAITPRNASHSVIPPFTSQINPNLSRKSDKSLLGFDIAADIDTLVKQSTKLK